MQQTSITAQPRQRKFKNDSKRLRKAGWIPAVLYGGDGEPVSLSVSDHTMEMQLRGSYRSSQLFELSIDGQEGTELAVIRAIVRHPVNDRLIHLDFLRLRAGHEFELEVAVHQVGATPKGVREGGILEHVQRTVTVRCKPRDIPGHIDVDLSNMSVHDAFLVSDLVLPDGVSVLDDPETPLFSIVAPAALTAEETAEEGAAEPELVSGRKEEQE